MNINQIVQIVSDLIVDPATGWEKHKNDFSSERQIFNEFVLPIVCVGALATFISVGIFGISFVFGLIFAAIFIITQLILVYVYSYIVKMMAAQFGASPTSLESFRFVAFGSSISWVGSLLRVVPFVGPIAAFILALYGIYVMWKGVRPILGVPEEKQVPFFLLTALVIIVASVVIGMLISSVTLMLGIGAAATGSLIAP